MAEEKIYTVKETAEMLRVSDDFVYARIKDGKMSHYEMGRRLVISEKHIEEFLKRNEVKTEDLQN